MRFLVVVKVYLGSMMQTVSDGSNWADDETTSFMQRTQPLLVFDAVEKEVLRDEI